jgi:hypothetical protein
MYFKHPEEITHPSPNSFSPKYTWTRKTVKPLENSEDFVDSKAMAKTITNGYSH